MDSEKKPRVTDAGAWGMNVVSSVGIIMTNKQLMSPGGYGFCYATTLTGFHFSVTALVGWVSNAAGLSVSKQISKLSIIPVVCTMEWILNNKHYSPKVIMSVIVVAFGVGICTVTDVEINMKGFLCACVAVFCTSLQQITIGSFQKKYCIGSFELLSKTAPIQAASLVVLGPFVDYCLSEKSILEYHLSTGALIFIILSCSLAVFCNMSQYLCIGRFSATTFQVLGHMKTICVLILGWILFDSALTIKNIFGMLVAVAGMIVYSWAVESEKLAKLTVSSRTDEENTRLLKDRTSGVSESDVELGQSKS